MKNSKEIFTKTKSKEPKRKFQKNFFKNQKTKKIQKSEEKNVKKIFLKNYFSLFKKHFFTLKIFDKK